MDERRQVERYNIEVPVKVVFNRGSSKKSFLNLRTKNISSLGAYIFTDEPVDEGVELFMELVLPMEKLLHFISNKSRVRLEVTGLVARSNSDGMAISFNKDYKIGAF